ncbi:PIG-L deacetylase family protein [Arcticibacter eurypsychrophilus]|uniref:PIG-L deacetylase family protein n=1 Tax=Arcticibacter eurypsychrophilus TaxID=1434752 RepID=UPI00084D9DCC|nr:PIG-L family deacetylase [Arcticibacter eurypsychrophilus]
MDSYKQIAIIVAHPDDETLWAGGTILNHPEWRCFIVSLCRKSDPDRAPKFSRVLKELNAEGIMGDLNDGPEQFPLNVNDVEHTLMSLLPAMNYDLIISHHPKGEYTSHIRHAEVSRAVINLWNAGKIKAPELWVFAFEDGNRLYFPTPIKNADLYFPLAADIWRHKYDIMTKIYGYGKDTWESQSTPKDEAFWQFTDSGKALNWLKSQENNESISVI